MRMGVVTGQGLADLIRERFGVRWTTLVMFALLVANTGVIISEFVGIAQASELFGIPRYFTVPLTALLIWWLVVKGSAQRVERVFLAMSLVFFGYVISALLAKPDWGEVGKQLVEPNFEFHSGYLFTVMALIGTTITPFMQVFVQSSVVEKGMDEEDLPLDDRDLLRRFAGLPLPEAALDSTGLFKIESFPRNTICRGVFDLTAGTYVFFDNLGGSAQAQGNFQRGMVAVVTVS